MFDDSSVVARAESCLDEMTSTSERLSAYHADDKSLQEAVTEYTRRWRDVMRHVDGMRTQLEEVPERWRDYNRRCASRAKFDAI